VAVPLRYFVVLFWALAAWQVSCIVLHLNIGGVGEVHGLGVANLHTQVSSNEFVSSLLWFGSCVVFGHMSLRSRNCANLRRGNAITNAI